MDRDKYIITPHGGENEAIAVSSPSLISNFSRTNIHGQLQIKYACSTKIARHTHPNSSLPDPWRRQHDPHVPQHAQRGARIPKQGDSRDLTWRAR